MTEVDLGRREDVLGHSHSFSKCFLGIHYVPGTVLSACDAPTIKQIKIPTLTESEFQCRGRQEEQMEECVNQ